MLVEGSTEGFEAWIPMVDLLDWDDFSFAGDCFFGGELGWGVLGGTGEISIVFFAGFSFKCFGIDMGIIYVHWSLRSLEVVFGVLMASLSLAECLLCLCQCAERDRGGFVSYKVF